MTLFFIFLDGVGFGAEELEGNPLFANEHPFLDNVLGGSGWELGKAGRHNQAADLYRLDATLGVPGLPQSATGQAVLLTGINIPKEIGEHYGPKPDARVAKYLSDGGLLGDLAKAGKRVVLADAYPKAYFDGINSGKRLYSAFPLAVTNAGYRLFDEDDLIHGVALSADITGEGWKKFFRSSNIPVRSAEQAGNALVLANRDTDLVIFEYWLTDHAGHKQNHAQAKELLSLVDGLLSGIYKNLGPEDLILVTSDHGNMEDLSTRRHTENQVPLILIGGKADREKFAGATSLLDVAPGIRGVLLEN